MFYVSEKLRQYKIETSLPTDNWRYVFSFTARKTTEDPTEPMYFIYAPSCFRHPIISLKIEDKKRFPEDFFYNLRHNSTLIYVLNGNTSELSVSSKHYQQISTIETFIKDCSPFKAVHDFTFYAAIQSKKLPECTAM